MHDDAASAADLLDAPHRALTLAPPDAAVMLARVEGLAAVLRIAAAAPAHEIKTAEPAPPADGGTWLTPDEAAAIARVPRRTVYAWSRRGDWRPFTHRLSRKVLRI